MTDKIIQLAKKIKALAERGEAGEKENALFMLAEFMKKHGISEYDIEGEKKKLRRFEVRKEQRQFFVQCVSSVIGNPQFDFLKNGNISVNLTDSDYAEIFIKFDFYWKLYEAEKYIFYKAFIQANKLYKKQSEDEKQSDEDIEETAEEKADNYRMAEMMMAIKRDSPHKRIT